MYWFRLLFASCWSRTSPMYSQTNVPRSICSQARNPHPCGFDQTWILELEQDKWIKKTMTKKGSHLAFCFKNFQFHANSILQNSILTCSRASAELIAFINRITLLQHFQKPSQFNQKKKDQRICSQVVTRSEITTKIFNSIEKQLNLPPRWSVLCHHMGIYTSWIFHICL